MKPNIVYTSQTTSVQPISEPTKHKELVEKSRKDVNILIPTKQDMVDNLLTYTQGDSLIVDSSPDLKIRVIVPSIGILESESFMEVRINDPELVGSSSFNGIIKFADIHENGTIPIFRKSDNTFYKEIHIAPKGYTSRKNKSLYF